MPSDDGFIHPYIPNAAPATRRRMLQAIGLGSAEDLYDSIPEPVRLRRPLDLPQPILAEQSLRRHLEDILRKNRHCGEALSFLGGGCAQHYVPAVCDEVAARGELLTAYGAWPYSDHGRFQAMFEYQSLLGELVGMEVVSTPTYDGGCAASSAALIACRLTGRREILVPDAMSPDRLSQLRGFTKPVARVTTVAHDAKTGLLDLADLKAKLGSATAVVLFETPGHLGAIEIQAPEIVDAAQRAGAMAVVAVDPISLGVLAAPGDYGADIVVGDLQPLGIHMNGGGGLAGFIATRDEQRIVTELPTFLVSIVPTEKGEGFGFGVSTMERTSYDKREAATDYYGTTQWLWGMIAGVYLSLLGPKGMAELGQGIMQRSQYAAQRLGAIKGVEAPLLSAPFFKELVVGFDGTGKSAAAVNRALLERGIYGGRPLKPDFPALGESALYCFTEMHSQADIDRLADAIAEIVR
jgi:glycine dehydrogenase subunit 1